MAKEAADEDVAAVAADETTASSETRELGIADPKVSKQRMERYGRWLTRIASNEDSAPLSW
jgi:hypothetical protein